MARKRKKHLGGKACSWLSPLPCADLWTPRPLADYPSMPSNSLSWPKFSLKVRVSSPSYCSRRSTKPPLGSSRALVAVFEMNTLGTYHWSTHRTATWTPWSQFSRIASLGKIEGSFWPEQFAALKENAPMSFYPRNQNCSRFLAAWLCHPLDPIAACIHGSLSCRRFDVITLS
jgi:hypothetical protein